MYILTKIYRNLISLSITLLAQMVQYTLKTYNQPFWEEKFMKIIHRADSLINPVNQLIVSVIPPYPIFMSTLYMYELLILLEPDDETVHIYCWNHHYFLALKKLLNVWKFRNTADWYTSLHLSQKIDTRRDLWLGRLLNCRIVLRQEYK